MRKLLGAGVLLAMAGVLLALVPLQAEVQASTPTPHPGIGSPGGLASYTKIKHVVIIYQENHTFDDVLGTVCAKRETPCNGYVGPVTFADGKRARDIVQPDVIPSPGHTPIDQQYGLHDQWDEILNCEKRPFPCISHVAPKNMRNLTRLADSFTVSDATFAAGHSASFGAHVTLVAGTFDGFAGYNPVPPGIGWGCPGHADALWGPPHHLTMQPACIPDRRGQGPYRPSKVPYTATVMERLEQAGLTWHIYEGRAAAKEPPLSPFSVCTYFWWCYEHRWNLGYDSGDPDFVAAATSGKLPTLSVMIPDGHTSQHGATSMRVGDDYIGDLVSAVENGPDWQSTAIFITYDDCGCFYDHVVPPSKSLGLRNPMVIVSPWARPDATDSTVAVQPYSMLAFVEHNFGLSPLTAEVDQAYDYANAFDFSQHPIAPVPMTTSPISPHEQRVLKTLLPTVEDDPT